MSHPTYLITEFADRHGINIDAFRACAEKTESVKKLIGSLYELPPCSPDEDIVFYGSIARRECTEASDIDWTLLVDGQASPDHLKMVNDARKKFETTSLSQPGSTGVFGQMSNSHDLINYIGGQADTNHNLTKRILLLLESTVLRWEGAETPTSTAYTRIVKGIINQYINNDSGMNSDRETIPRFLLNDMVRYWRTMCVDFAYKQIEQEGNKWALRNIKLRISRKMLFVKGLLICFSHKGTRQDKAAMIDSICAMVPQTPFELLIKLQSHFGIATEDIAALLQSYNTFLTKIGDQEVRDKLNNLHMDDVYKSDKEGHSTFINLRETADELQQALDNIFIFKKGPLRDLTLSYGIF